MKKIFLTLTFLILIIVLNNITLSNAETMANNKIVVTNNFNKTPITNEVENLKKEIYEKNVIQLIQSIEIESEIIIPKRLDPKYVMYILKTSKNLDIPKRISFRLIHQESRFIDTLVSRAGATGFMQLMPDTRSTYAKQLRVDTIIGLDVNQKDIYIGLTYLSNLHKYWVLKGHSNKYSWRLSLASYNAGKGKVIHYNGVPPYKETINFVEFILKAPSNPKFIANYNKKYSI